MSTLYEKILKIKEESDNTKRYLTYESLERNLEEQNKLKKYKYIALIIIDGVNTGNVKVELCYVYKMKEILEKIKLNFDENLEDLRTKRVVGDYDFGNTYEELLKKLLPDTIIEKMNNGDIPVDFKEKNQGFL